MSITKAAPAVEEEFVEINTRYGKQLVAKASLLTFPQGLPGFEDLRQYKLFHEEGTTTVHYLQSTEDPDIRLPLVESRSCNIDYRLELSDEEIRELGFKPGHDLIVLLTLSDDIDQPAAGIRANYLAPILINADTHLGIQKPLHQVSGGLVIQAS